MNSSVSQATLLKLKTTDRPIALTHREVQVLDLIARGCEYREIAEELDISIDTVKTHVKKIYLRLNARNAPHAVSIAIARQLIATGKSK